MATNQSISRVRKYYPPTKPTVTTTTVTNTTSTTTTAGGNVTNEGTFPVTERGVCYSTSNTPTTSSSKQTSGTGAGSFSVSITGLNPNTTYYYRAYAISSAGTSYGTKKSLVTNASGLPVVTTTSVTEIFNTTAISGGNATSAGSSSITDKGICYATTTNPTILNTKISGGSGTGSFTSNLTGLMQDTRYYIRAYATNSSGTSYGDQVTFQTTNVVQIPFSLYIDDFDAILGNETAETTLKDFIVEKNITQPIFYMGTLLSNSSNRTAMRAFNTSLNSVGVVERSANVTSAIAVDEEDPSSKASFNIGCTTNAQKFTNFRSEIEFYKANAYVDSFAEFMVIADEIKTWCDANNVTYDCYYARAKDIATVNPMTPEEVADYLVATFDVLCLVNYILPSKFATYGGFSPSIVAQFQLIADAANRAGKTQKMDMIFASQGNIVNGTPENMRDFYVANPTLIPSYNSAKSTFNGLSLTNKDNINFLSQTIYARQGVYDL